MKWTRASEKPKEYKNYHVRCKGKLGNIYDTTVIWGHGKWYYECKQGDPVVEWLDESPESSVWPGEEEIIKKANDSFENMPSREAMWNRAFTICAKWLQSRTAVKAEEIQTLKDKYEDMVSLCQFYQKKYEQSQPTAGGVKEEGGETKI